MPSFPARLGKRLALATCLLAVFLGKVRTTASAQTLARPGWVGSGLNTDPWWQHAIFYQISTPNPDFKDIAARLDALRSLGIDAILLPALTPLQTSAAPAQSLDDFDDLIRQGSRAGIRIMVSLPASSATPDLARFWLNRGIAGLRIVPTPETSLQQTQALVQSLRKLTAGVVGQRIILSANDLTPVTAPIASQPARQPIRRASASPTPRSADPTPAAGQLLVDSRLSDLHELDAPTLRSILSQTITQPNLLLQFQPATPTPGSPDPYPALAHAIAAILLTTHTAALIDSSENLVLKPTAPPTPEPTPPPAPAAPQPASGFSTFTLVVPHPKPPPPKPPTPEMLAALALTDWYKQLAVLHHGNAAFRSGSITLLNFDQQNALVWVARPPTVSTLTPPVVVLCNLSSSPVKLALGPAIKGLNLRGHYLHTLLRSDNAMGAQDIDAVALSPFSVYIGELRR